MNEQIPEKKTYWWDLVIVLYHTFVIISATIVYAEDLLLSILGISLTAAMLMIFLVFFKTRNPFLNWLSFGLTIPIYLYAIPLYSFYLRFYVVISTWDLIFPIFIVIALIDSYFLFKRYKSSSTYSRIAILKAFSSSSHQMSTQSDQSYVRWLQDDFENDEKQKEAKKFLEKYYKYNLILAIDVIGTILYLVLTILNYIR
jgi:hypothetical protein